MHAWKCVDLFSDGGFERRFMMHKIPIYIGISNRFDCIKGMTERSILRNTKSQVDIKYLYPKHEAGCTGFSNIRYTIKQGIYLDVDMIVLGDIVELWEYKVKGKFVCMENGSTAVAVIDCNHRCENKKQEDRLPKACRIPMIWNVEDYKYINKPLPENMKLLHFTNIHTQPWFFEHPDERMVEIYEQYILDKATYSNFLI